MKKRNNKWLKIVGVLFILLIAFIIFVMKSQGSLSGKIKDGLIGVMTKSLQSSCVPKINVDLAASHPADYIFLDSRQQKEYDVSHIKNSIYVGDQDFSIEKLSQIPKNAGIVVYCSVGVRSDKIAKEIIDAGYTKVHNMLGGIFEWINEGYPVYDSTGIRTSSVHGYSKFWGAFVNSDHKVYY
ncbi:MAG: rhodanese-like domain-containing protein [Ginsengibacter sp.]